MPPSARCWGYRRGSLSLGWVRCAGIEGLCISQLQEVLTWFWVFLVCVLFFFLSWSWIRYCQRSQICEVCCSVLWQCSRPHCKPSSYSITIFASSRWMDETSWAGKEGKKKKEERMVKLYRNSGPGRISISFLQISLCAQRGHSPCSAWD